jgi:uncharacterized protein
MKYLTQILLGLMLVILIPLSISYNKNPEKILSQDWSFWQDLFNINNVLDVELSEQKINQEILRNPENFLSLLDYTIISNFDDSIKYNFKLKRWSEELKVTNLDDIYFQEEYYDDGMMKSEQIYADSSLVFSINLGYYKNNKKKFENIYRNGDLVIKTLWEYYGDGKIKKIFIHNLLDYEIKTKDWFSNGQIKSIAMFSSGMADGRFKSKYPNGEDKKNAHYYAGNLDGSLSTFYENGKRKEEQYYVNYKKSGRWYEYYKNGQIKVESVFQNGENIAQKKWDKNGVLLQEINNKTLDEDIWEYYDPDCIIEPNCSNKGNKKSHSKFFYSPSNDLTKVVVKSWHENGFRKSIGTYKNNLKHELWRHFDETGYLIKSIYYINGNKLIEEEFLDKIKDNQLSGHIKFTEWYKSGAKMIYKEIIDGKIVKMQEWYENGQRKYDGKYLNSLMDGKWVFYRADGSIQKEINYQNGSKEGRSVTWYLNGNKELEENYIDGLLNGRFVSYRLDGKIEHESNFVNGIKHGKSVWWNGNGAMRLEHNYEYGVVTL